MFITMLQLAYQLDVEYFEQTLVKEKKENTGQRV